MNISAGDYRAKIRCFGGGLSELKFEDRNLIEPYVETDISAHYRGDLLAPWPNRIRDGRYQIDGYEYFLPINEIVRNNALHGLINGVYWQVKKRVSSEVVLEVTLPASDFYPTTLHMSVRYCIGKNGLIWSLLAKNVGSAKVPYGASIHPYLIGHPGELVDDWMLQIAADEVLDVDAKRLLPLDTILVGDKNFDFRSGSIIGRRFIDHAFKIASSSLEPRVDVTAKSGSGVRMEFDSSSQWVQIHTADRGGEKGNRSSLAVEPMSCPPDAFNSGIDLIWLRPGDEHEMTWKICAI